MNNKKNVFFAPWLFSLIVSGALVACQSQVAEKTTIIKSPERPLEIIRSPDGMQNLAWRIEEIAGQKAKFFHQQPTLILNQNGQRLLGNTGCNLLSGSYEINTQKQQLTLQAKAGHQSCHEALAQEANLMEVLSQIRSFRLQGNRLQLLNGKQNVILTAEK